MSKNENLLEGRDLTVSYGSLTVLNRISFVLREGEWLMIAGPNGAGKSTIISTISGEAPYSGQILFKNRDIRSYKSTELARNIGILSQNHFVGYSFTIREVVGLGRYAYKKGLLRGTDEDKEALVDQALEMTGLTKLQNQSVLQLSGGELQRTFLAQVFAQDPEVLILDEPTNHLDLVYQKQIFALISNWVKRKGRAVISVVHDLSLAKAFGNRALLLNRGQVVAEGENSTVFAPEPLAEAYSMDVYGWMQEMLGQWT